MLVPRMSQASRKFPSPGSKADGANHPAVGTGGGEGGSWVLSPPPHVLPLRLEPAVGTPDAVPEKCSYRDLTMLMYFIFSPKLTFKGTDAIRVRSPQDTDTMHAVQVPPNERPSPEVTSVHRLLRTASPHVHLVICSHATIGHRACVCAYACARVCRVMNPDWSQLCTLGHCYWMSPDCIPHRVALPVPCLSLPCCRLTVGVCKSPPGLRTWEPRPMPQLCLKGGGCLAGAVAHQSGSRERDSPGDLRRK